VETRGTGLKQNKPPGWETGSHVNFSPDGPNRAPQGPGKGIMPTSRGMQAPIPGEIDSQLQQSPGGFLRQILMGRPRMEAERARPGDAAAVGQFGPSDGPMVTKEGVQGGAAQNPHIGGGKGGF
jgi:hypothetical protein